MQRLLHQPEYIHAAINHLPLVGLLVAMMALAIALVARNRGAILIGLALVTVFSLSVWPVLEFGEEGFDRVFSMADENGQAFLRYHEQLAHRWVFLYYVTAGIGALGFGLAWKFPRTLNPFAIVSLAAALASLAAGILIAQAGGEVRHREFRFRPPPAVATEPEH